MGGKKPDNKISQHLLFYPNVCVCSLCQHFFLEASSSPGYSDECSRSRKDSWRGRWLDADMSKDVLLYTMPVEMLEESPDSRVLSLCSC